MSANLLKWKYQHEGKGVPFSSSWQLRRPESEPSSACPSSLTSGKALSFAEPEFPLLCNGCSETSSDILGIKEAVVMEVLCKLSHLLLCFTQVIVEPVGSGFKDFMSEI